MRKIKITQLITGSGVGMAVLLLLLNDVLYLHLPRFPILIGALVTGIVYINFLFIGLSVETGSSISNALKKAFKG